MGALLSPTAQTEKKLAICVALVAGYVDAYTLRAFSTYVSFMSGNTTQTGLLIGQNRIAAALLPALAIITFLAGSFAGTWLGHSGIHHSRRLLFGIVSALLALLTGINLIGGFSARLQVAAFSLAMGMMNTALSRVGAEPVSLTFVTGTLNRIGAHLALAFKGEALPDPQGPFDTHLRRACLVASVWGGFVTGAILSGAAASRFGAIAIVPPSLILLALALFSREERAKKTVMITDPRLFENKAVSKC